MFSVGEKVVYPVHGAGIIEAIEQRDILGEIRSYYVLRLSTGELQVLIPVDAVDTTGMRCICSASEIEDVKIILAGESSFWEDNWNRRYRQNMDKIKSGDILEIAEVVRNLTLRDMEKGVSAGEKKMLDNARKILISEIVLASSISVEDAASDLQEIFVKKEDQ
jgi:CarD family transcriptional regulator